MIQKREKHVKYDALDYRWHEYYEVSFGFAFDDTVHVFVLDSEALAFWAYYSATENESIEWAVVHHVWYGRKCWDIDSNWLYDSIVWFGID